MDAPDGGPKRSRTRRGVLRAAGAAGAFLLAGCTQDVGKEFPPNRKWPVSEYKPELPVEERTATMAHRIEATADADVADPEDLGPALPDGIEVESVERDRDVLHVEYASDDRYATGVLPHVASLAGAYAALVDAGYDTVAMSITVLDDAPSTYGHATVETTWAEAYVVREETAKEYAEHVAGTVETTREPPEIDVSPGE